MSFKAKIKARLKAKWPGVNLSTKRIDNIASKLKLEEDAEDDDIDEKLDEINDVFPFADMVKHDDRVRTLEARKQKKDSDVDPDIEIPIETKTPDPEMPAWAKTLVDSNKALTEKLEKLESGKTADTRKQTLENKLKDIDPKFKAATLKAFGRMNFESDEDFETYLSEIEEDAKEFVQTPDDDDDKVPFSRPLVPSGSGGGKSKQVSKEEADAILDKII